MAFGEVVKAIQWNSKTTDQHNYPVIAYLVLHNGTTSKEPVTTLMGDQVWYVHGPVVAVLTPTPHLAGTLTRVFTDHNGGDMTLSPKISVSVQVFPDGKLTVLRMINGVPIGGMPPTQLQASDVGDNLMVAVEGTEVWTLGVARAPDGFVGPS